MELKKMFSLEGRTALVTGSSRGIGRGIALALAEAGAGVAVHSSGESDALKQTTADVAALGVKAGAFAADLSKKDETEALPGRIAAELGAIDILVLNASVQSYQTFEEFTPEEFEWQYNVNMGSSFMLIRDTIESMKQKKWGRILGIGSVNQWKPSPRLPIYASSKSALVNMMINCARQYAPFGITANNLAPGVILTDRNRDALKDKEYYDKVMTMVPAGFFGTVEDCAGLALTLCSEAGRYITGADIPVTGGMHL